MNTLTLGGLLPLTDGNPENTFKNLGSVRAPGDMAINQELVNTLRGLGLNQYEARAYLALCSTGANTAGELSERAELPRPRVYDVLKGLQDKGFVAVKPGRPVKYAGMPIQEAVKTLKRHRETQLGDELKRIEELGTSLATRLDKASPPSRVSAEDVVWTLRGQDALYSKMSTMIAAAKSHVTIASTAQGALRKIRLHQKELEAAKQRGARIHVLSPTSLGDMAKLVHGHSKGSLPTRMLLADNEALVFLTEEGTPVEDEVGVWVKSPHLTASLRALTGAKG